MTHPAEYYTHPVYQHPVPLSLAPQFAAPFGLSGGLRAPLQERVPTAYAAIAMPFSSHPACSTTVPHAAVIDPYLKAASDNVIQQEITAQGSEPFTGDAVTFWAWLGRMKENIDNFAMKPRAVMRMLSTNTAGAPHDLVTSRTSTAGVVDYTTVESLWLELIERYGSQQLAFNQQMIKLNTFPAIKAPKIAEQLYSLGDLCHVTSTLIPLCPDLHVLDFAVGLTDLVRKLPQHLQHRWEKVQFEYSHLNQRRHPPFVIFAQYLREQAQREASRVYVTALPESTPLHSTKKPAIARVLATTVAGHSSSSSASSNDRNYCLEHQAPGHHISKCRRFYGRPMSERQELIKEHLLCFACLCTGHRSKECTNRLSCDKCEGKHPSVLHSTTPFKRKEPSAESLETPPSSTVSTPSEPPVIPPVTSTVTLCTQICGTASVPRTCAKTLLVEASLASNPAKIKHIYVAIDDQSNVSFIDNELVEFFGVTFPVQSYRMSSAQRGCCISTKGFQVSGLRLRGLFNKHVLHVPLALSCSGLLDTRSDAATPATARAHSHLTQYTHQFPEFDPSAHTMVLLGRDCGEAMAAKLLSREEPFLYETPLGLALVGSVCLTGEKSSYAGPKELTKYCNTLCTKVFRSEPASAPSETVCTPSEPVSAPSEPVSAPTEPVSAPSEPVSALSEPLSAPSEPVSASSEPETARNTTQSEPVSALLVPNVPVDIHEKHIFCENNYIPNPCFHTLCSVLEPNLTTPVYVQDQFATSGSRSSRDDVFSHRPGEALSLLMPSTCVSSGEVCAPDKDVFLTRPDDESPGPSQGDCAFLDLLSKEVSVTESGNIQLPLPFKNNMSYLPDNSSAVYGRTLNTLNQLKKCDWKIALCLESMQHNVSQGYVEPLSERHPTPEIGAVWYLPIFPVVNTKKAKVRLVFDASAQYMGVSINDKLNQGPDLSNRLRGVLLRFREKPVAIQADIQDMFLNFKVPESQRDYLRFYWFKDNDSAQPLVPYRATTHIFGLTSSPAVANFGLKHCALLATDPKFSTAVKYILYSFYMDDGLYSLVNPGEAVEVLQHARTLLATHNIRLHKIISNSKEVLQAFPSSEVSAPAEPSEASSLSVQRALGVAWDVQSDTFSPTILAELRPFTKRGILATVNALAYDPTGLISPITLVGKLFQREIFPPKKSSNDLVNYAWDDPLPDSYRPKWDEFVDSLSQLSKIKVARNFYPLTFHPVRQELHVFCDASKDAIGHVIYLRSVSADDEVRVSFVTSGSRVAPHSAVTIPRLELCAAAEAAKAAVAVLSELVSKPDKTYYYSDSMVVLGYLANCDRRYTLYVARRVQMTLLHTSISDWSYVNTLENPADFSSRPTLPEALINSFWYSGPSFLQNSDFSPIPYDASTVQEPLPEERPSEIETVTLATTVVPPSGISLLFTRVSSLDKLIRVVLILLKWKLAIVSSPQTTPTRESALKALIRTAQSAQYESIINLLRQGKELPKCNSLAQYSPFLDDDGILRVGGRLSRATVPFDIKHPIILSNHPFAHSLVRHLHSEAKHQGSHITSAVLRQAGYYLVGGTAIIKKFINQCFLCKKLRGKLATQFMSDLPLDRLQDVPPFENVGLDCFGPFFIKGGRATRNTSASTKIWVLIFVCLPSRAIHLEVLEGLDTSSFINALFRFSAIRGTCRFIRSDQGTNFVGACNLLDNIDLNKVSSTIKSKKDITWQMNPPHSSHHGGVWERRIGSVRRVLEGALLQSGKKGLSRDDFVTLLLESAAVVNNTPLWAVSSDPDDPLPLSPATLLTLRDQPCVVPRGAFSESDLHSYGPRRYRRVQHLVDQFWVRWRREHLHQLTLRRKWQRPTRPFMKGDVVLVRDPLAARNHWPTGVILKVIPSTDGRIRSAEISLPSSADKIARRSAIRGIHDLVLLATAEELVRDRSDDVPH